MHFDDRLATVLRLRAAGERAARTQYRQLLDLLGNGPATAAGERRDQSLLAAAWLRLDALGESIPAADRARIVRDPGLRLQSRELALHLADDDPAVAAAVLGRADLAADDWEALIPRLPVRARGFLRLRRDLPPATGALLDRLGIHDRGLPQPDAAAMPADAAMIDAPAPDAPAPPEAGTIGALVRRIEAFRESRAKAHAAATAPRLPLEHPADADLAPIARFGFTANAHGRIDWADPAVAPMVIGTSLGTAASLPQLRHRQPLHDLRLTLAGADAIAGPWRVRAAPRFTSPEGLFAGYAGTFVRDPGDDADDAASAEVDEADRLRQLLHELRTPANAIQGFAEVIQQQLYGPTPHEYRALAATIAGDGARMLAGFEEIDRLARLEAGALAVEPGSCDLAAIITHQVEQLQQVLKPRTAGFEFEADAVGPAALDGPEAEGLCWRLLATLAGAVGAGEWLQVELGEARGRLRLCCELPAQLGAEDDIFAAAVRPANSALSAGMFGAGFALRLARAEARSAGGDLVRVDDWLILTLPPLTGADRTPSPVTDSAA